MTDVDDSVLVEQLEHFGLSETEIQTYLAVLENGEAKASTIADATGVSKRYVYSVCEELEAGGFVEVDDHVVPTKIRAKPPEEVIEMLSARLEEIEPELEQRYSAEEPPRQRFDVIKSRVTVRKRINEYIEDAEQYITLSIPYEELPEVRDQLQDAVERGIFVLLLVSDAELGPDAFESDDRPIANVVRSWDIPVPVMLTVDREFGIMSSSEMLTVANSDERAISLVQGEIVSTLFDSFLANFWVSADQHYVTDPAPLPRTYDTIQQAVFEATLHLRDGKSIIARVEATSNTGDSETETITGRVVETRQGIVDPITNEFPIEHTLVLETDTGETTVGGRTAFVEEYAARSLTLEFAE